jgi:hypothetical protein
MVHPSVVCTFESDWSNNMYCNAHLQSAAAAVSVLSVIEDVSVNHHHG